MSREAAPNISLDRERAWVELHAATPPGWFAGRPGQRHGGEWAMYAFDTTEKAHIGRRSREWTAVGQTEVECIREKARCLREISEDRVPKKVRRAILYLVVFAARPT